MEIIVNNVSKTFNKKDIVLNNVSLKLTSGKIYGFTGRNGSGKTVLLKLLCGYYKPSKGDILYDNKSIVSELSYPPNTRTLIENPSFIANLTGYQNLKLLADIEHKIGKEEIEQALKDVDLYSEKDKNYSKYSLGMKQKLGIAQVIMEDPQVMILDEPLNGIEKQSADKIRNLLKKKKEEGKLIIIASHIKEDFELLADEVYNFDVGNVKKINM